MKNVKSFYLALFLPFILLSFSASAQKLTFTELQDSLKSIIIQEDLPGLSLAIISKKDSFYWSGGLGMANIEENKPMTENSTLFVASVSKNLVALASLKLVEEGRLNLKTNIRDIIPEINFENDWEDLHPITVEMVLEHTTGFDEMRYNNFISETDELLPLKEVLNKYPNGLKSRWRPGTLFSYSNMNYTVAGYIIEKITAMTLEEYLRLAVLEPIGMNQSTLSNFSEKTEELAIPYSFDFENDKIVRFFPNDEVGKHFTQRPASLLITSSKDMLNYLNMYLNNGRHNEFSMEERLLDRMENGETGLAAKLKLPGRYGLGNKAGLREVRLFGHQGQAWNQAFFVYNREAGIGYYVATNCGYAIPKVRQLLNQFLLQNYESSDPKNRTSVNVAKDYEGFYETINSRNQNQLWFDKIRFAGNLEVRNDTVYFDGGIKMRKYTAHGDSKPGMVKLVREDKGFERRKNLTSVGLTKDENAENIIVWDSGTSMIYFKKVSPLIYYWKFYSLLGSLIILGLSSLIFLVMVVINLIKKRRHVSLVYIFTWLATVSLIFMLYVFVPMHPLEQIKLGSINLKTVVFFILSLLFPIMALWQIFVLFKTYNKQPKLMKVLYFINGYAFLYMTAFLLLNGFVGFRFWAY